jgi:hypothetical protein
MPLRPNDTPASAGSAARSPQPGAPSVSSSPSQPQTASAPAPAAIWVPTSLGADAGRSAAASSSSADSAGSGLQRPLSARPPSRTAARSAAEHLPPLPGDPRIAGTAVAAQRAADAAAEPPQLTRMGLQEWVKQPGISGEERTHRAEASKRIIKASRPSARTRPPKAAELLSALSSAPITIAGSLDLADLNYLSSLPDGLRVGRSLSLRDCTALTHLPDGLRVRGYLELDRCTALTYLPDGLRVGEYLSLDGCTALTHLPDGLRVGRDLHLFDCTALTHLPNGLRVGGDLDLHGCTALTQLPNQLRVGGGLDLFDCTALTHLPDGMRVGGFLRLGNCTALTHLPDGLQVGGDLDLSGLTALTHLPDGLQVGGGLDLGGCTALTHLLDGLQVGTFLSLNGCNALTHLPDGLRAEGHLDLRGCTALTHLPDGLRVGGDLDLRGCIALTNLPDWLRVEGNLILRGCTALTHLPDGLRVGRDLGLTGCTALQTLPEAVLAWPLRSDGRPHEIDVTNSGISAEHALELGQNRQSIRINSDVGEHANSQEPALTLGWTQLPEAIAFWHAQLEPQDPQNPQDPSAFNFQNLPWDQAHNLFNFLARIRETQDYIEGGGNRRRLALLTREMLQLASYGSDDPRSSTVHQAIADALTNCGDRVSRTLNEIGIIVREKAALESEQPREALVKLGRGLLGLEVVRLHAEKRNAELGSVDPVDTYLAMEIGAAQQIPELPVACEHMTFTNIAQVKPQHINAAVEQARTAMADPEQLQGYLATWPAWMQFMQVERARGLEYEQLPTLPLSVDQLSEAFCVISQYFYAELEKPVLYKRDKVKDEEEDQYEVFEFAYLQKYWVLNPHGGLPQNRDSKLSFERLYRPQSFVKAEDGVASEDES